MLDTVSFYKPTETGAYPIVLATYEIVCSKYPGCRHRQGRQGVPAVDHRSPARTGLADNGYIPLPAEFQSKLSTAVNAIS